MFTPHQINHYAARRPPGWGEAIRAVAKVHRATVEIAEADWQRINRAFGSGVSGTLVYTLPERPVVPQKSTPAPVVAPMPFERWPRWAKWIARQRQDPDSGVGDTFRRLAAKVGGEQIKRLAKANAVPCGCTERQAEWNVRYRYGPPATCQPVAVPRGTK